MAHTRTTTGLLLLPCGLWVDDIEWFGGGGVCRRQPARPPSPSPPEPPPPSPVAEPLPTSRTPAPTRDTQPALLLLLFCLVFLPALSRSRSHSVPPKAKTTANQQHYPRARLASHAHFTGARRADRPEACAAQPPPLSHHRRRPVDDRRRPNYSHKGGPTTTKPGRGALACVVLGHFAAWLAALQLLLLYRISSQGRREQRVRRVLAGLRSEVD